MCLQVLNRVRVGLLCGEAREVWSEGAVPGDGSANEKEKENVSAV
jgi:hypothetical protein